MASMLIRGSVPTRQLSLIEGKRRKDYVDQSSASCGVIALNRVYFHARLLYCTIGRKIT